MATVPALVLDRDEVALLLQLLGVAPETDDPELAHLDPDVPPRFTWDLYDLPSAEDILRDGRTTQAYTLVRALRRALCDEQDVHAH